MLMTTRPLQCFLRIISNGQRKARGFTLLELLISLVIASLVTSGLLYMVNELIRIDRREANLENVQRDMQRSIDYIADEVRESVYVYPDPTFITDQMTAGTLPSGAIPVLAFWKPKSLGSDYGELAEDCDTLAALPAPNIANCKALKLRQSYYSLVVYFTLANAGNNPNWKGQARIARYELPQYTTAGLATATETAAYASPYPDFGNWTRSTPTAGAPTASAPSVLVDFVDSPSSAVGSMVSTCDEFGTDYTQSPATGSDSFVACIGAPGEADSGSNQEVVILLRGNLKTAAQESSNPTTTGTRPNESVLPTLKTRVLVRGAANKNPGGAP